MRKYYGDGDGDGGGGGDGGGDSYGGGDGSDAVAATLARRTAGIIAKQVWVKHT